MNNKSPDSQHVSQEVVQRAVQCLSCWPCHLNESYLEASDKSKSVCIKDWEKCLPIRVFKVDF